MKRPRNAAMFFLYVLPSALNKIISASAIVEIISFDLLPPLPLIHKLQQ